MTNEETVEVGFRCPKSLNDHLEESVERLKAYDIETSRSDVIRTLLQYRMSNAVGICKQMLKPKVKKGK